VLRYALIQSGQGSAVPTSDAQYTCEARPSRDKRSYNVHFKGVFLLTQSLLPLINDGGRIVNVSTGLTRFVAPGSAAYASMKGAVEILTRYQAKELGARGITVNTVAPGAMATDFSGGMVRDNPELHQRVSEMTALGRVEQPDDIGPVIATRPSDGNRWINASLRRWRSSAWLSRG